MSLYYVLTAMTSKDGSTAGFYIRKTLPVVVIAFFPAALISPSPVYATTPLGDSRALLVGWLLRFGVMDSLIDFFFLVAPRNNSAKGILSGLWMVLLWQLNGVYMIAETWLLGGLTCGVTILLGALVLLFDLNILWNHRNDK